MISYIFKAIYKRQGFLIELYSKIIYTVVNRFKYLYLYTPVLTACVELKLYIGRLFITVYMKKLAILWNLWNHLDFSILNFISLNNNSSYNNPSWINSYFILGNLKFIIYVLFNIWNSIKQKIFLSFLDSSLFFLNECFKILVS